MTGIDQTSFDLSVKNPNKAEEAALRDPQDIIAEIAALDVESAEVPTSGVAVKRGGRLSGSVRYSNLIARGVAPKYTETDGIRVLNQKCIRDHAINYQLARRHDASVKRVSPDRFPASCGCSRKFNRDRYSW